MDRREKAIKIEENILRNISGDEMPANLYVCPNCHHKLRIKFEFFMRGSKELLGIEAECDTCEVMINTDLIIENAPNWLRALQT